MRSCNTSEVLLVFGMKKEETKEQFLSEDNIVPFE